ARYSNEGEFMRRSPFGEGFVQVKKDIGDDGPRGQVLDVHFLGSRPKWFGGQVSRSLRGALKLLARSLEEHSQALGLLRTWRPGQAQTEAILGSLRDAAPTLGNHTAGQGLGGFDVDGVIERYQGLQGGIGAQTANVAHGPFGSVEGRHGRVGGIAPPED